MTQPQPLVTREAGSPLLVLPSPLNMPVTRVPVTWERGAVKAKQAAAYLGISTTQLWKLTQLGKIKRTSYKTYPVCELDRHLREEVK